MTSYRFITWDQAKRIRHETVIPADTYAEALDILGRNAARTTGVPVIFWHWLPSQTA